MEIERDGEDLCLVDGEGNLEPIDLPRKWEICGSCEGEGTALCEGLRGVAFTSEEMDEDPDFRSSYFGGHYDVACPDCSGTGKVKEIDWVKLEATRPGLAGAIRKFLDDEAGYEAAYAYERRMGY